MDRVAGEHAVRDLPMLHRNPIDIPRAMQGQLRQIQHLPIVAGLQQSAPAISQHASSEFLGKLIVTGRHGRMGRKDTLFTNVFDKIGRYGFCLALQGQFLFHQREYEQGGMPLIHMEPEKVLVPERPQQTESPDSQHYLLT